MTDIRKQVSYTLRVPVTVEGRELQTLTFRRLKGKDIREMERKDSNLDKTAHAICTLSGNPPELFDELDAEDIEGISKIIESFMNRKAKA